MVKLTFSKIFDFSASKIDVQLVCTKIELICIPDNEMLINRNKMGEMINMDFNVVYVLTIILAILGAFFGLFFHAFHTGSSDSE
ncbi:MAG: hypothetical protein K9W45_08730 [Candidatus Heimdallarchaeum aukensis]|uniref:Uncharacterized protein n=1 Tax=Candidatus Heimdallarchaeum aukensis TaxID=2876573 RepID=A0A9Y1FKU9_9ARCH|nr:MAG: hypothetical protein K9W45_08730 [Candidatus Heimdallarchaeum aukensis]